MTRLEGSFRFAAPASVVAVGLALLSTCARADTYTTIQIGVLNAGSAGVAGIDDAGNALYINNSGNQYYSIYAPDGEVTYRGNTRPAFFVPDDGSSCPVSYMGNTYQGVCNNGYEAVGITSPFNSVPIVNTFVIGHDGTFTTLNLGNPGRLIFQGRTNLNSSGDVAFSVVGQEDSFLAHNTTPTPEPSTWALLLTGVGLISAVRRRLS